MNIARRIYRLLLLNNLKCLLSDFFYSKFRIKDIKSNEIKKLSIIRISVKDSTFEEYIQLQTLNRTGVVRNTLFATTLLPDLNVVINSPNPYVPLLSKSAENWLFHIEPPGYINFLQYNDEKILSKFTRVYTCDPELYNRGGKFIASPPYVHWHIGVNSYCEGNAQVSYDYDFLKKQISPPNKDFDIVTINSNINNLPGHKRRAEFIEKLCNSDIDFKLYGGSNWSKYPQYVDNAPNGKWPVFSRSRYVLVIENEVAPFYWTEKITDTILCWSMPIYFGCPNVDEYLPEGSYIKLDITKDDAISQLRSIIASTYYEDNIDNIAKARTLILEKYNILNFIASEFDKLKN